MKSIMTFAAVALCGLSVLIAGCKEETQAEKLEKSLKTTAAETGKAVDKAAADGQKAADKAATDAKKAADGLKQ